VVIEILVAKGESEKTLPQQILYGVFNAVLIAGIGEALGKQTADTQAGIHLAQEKEAAIGTNNATLEVATILREPKSWKSMGSERRGVGEGIPLV
jgi:hypothetical protein